MSYIDGFVAAVPQENKQAYLGKVTDFHRSVHKEAGEAVLFSWIEWPSKDVRDAGMTAPMADARMKTLKMPFDGQRMIFGGFSPIVETGSARSSSPTCCASCRERRDTHGSSTGCRSTSWDDQPLVWGIPAQRRVRHREGKARAPK